MWRERLTAMAVGVLWSATAGLIVAAVVLTVTYGAYQLLWAS